MKNTPKYLVIAEEIAKSIAGGEIGAGGKVPSENDIAKRWGVSCSTSRKTLLELELRGLVKRVRGKGTVVLQRDGFFLSRALGSFSALKGSFASNLRREGIAAKVETVEKKVFRGKVDIQVAGNFYEIVGKIAKLRVFRYGNSRMLKDETLYFDASLLPEIEKFDDIDNPLEFFASQYGVVVEKVDRNIFAKSLDAGEGNGFSKSQPTVVMCLEGANLLGLGRVVAIEKSLYRADAYKFTISTPFM